MMEVLVITRYSGHVVISGVAALPCPDLEEPENGRLTMNSNKHGSRATIRCNKGFKRMGPRVRRCLSTGLWSEFAPVCVPRNPDGISFKSL